ncbi:hypothetical protein [Kribbella rubisoli]|nr:hypothetical protein [Kribbella rubisoli]
MNHESAWYEIRLEGRIDPRWAAWFDGLTVSAHADGTSVIHGQVADQAALHGLLQRLRDLGLPLLSVDRVDPDQTQRKLS